MAAVSDNAPSWADQWGATEDLEEDNNAKAKEKGGNKKKGDVKAAASLTLDKAKATAAAGANKVKNGTLMGMKWVKSKCQKGTSK